MRTDVAYAIVDGRNIENLDKLDPIGILEMAPNELRIRMISGRMFFFSLETDAFEDEGDTVSLYTDSGPIHLTVIHEGHDIFEELTPEEAAEGPAGLYQACAQAMR